MGSTIKNVEYFKMKRGDRDTAPKWKNFYLVGWGGVLCFLAHLTTVGLTEPSDMNQDKGQ